MDLFSFFKTIIFLILICEVQSLPPWFNDYYPSHGEPQYKDYFCNDSDALAVTLGLSGPYSVWIKDVLEDGTEITVKFNSVATVFLSREWEYKNMTNLKLKQEDDDSINNIYKFEFTNKTKDLRELFRVKADEQPHHPPYIISFKINGIEKCYQPILGYFEDFTYNKYSKYFSEAPNKFCGRRKVRTQSIRIPLIVGGSATTAGWWPWHAAVYALRKGSLTYTCGGTLISNYLVLTAAHCVTLNSATINPEILGVHLGKYSLFGQEATSQTIGVFEVIVHDDFEHRSLNNDIALIKLLAAAQYNNYVQPACLWFDGVYDQIRTFELTGTVPGWGFDATDTLTKTLLTATMTIVPDVTCILFEPVFYQKVLNGKKFCAGHQNGTSPCNGDSGGGYVIFVYDKKNFPAPEQNAGAWYVKGIVSMTLSRSDASVCDPNGYTVFTDVAQYRNWILNYLNRET